MSHQRRLGRRSGGKADDDSPKADIMQLIHGPFPNPLDPEMRGKKQTLEDTKWLRDEQISQLLHRNKDEIRREIVEEYKNAGIHDFITPEEIDFRAKKRLKAIEGQIAALKLADVKDDISHQYMTNCLNWILGHGTVAEVQLTPWGRKYVGTRDVTDTIRMFPRKRSEFLVALANLRMLGPQNMVEFILYYKYFINCINRQEVKRAMFEDGVDAGKPSEVKEWLDDPKNMKHLITDDFLKDWDAFFPPMLSTFTAESRDGVNITVDEQETERKRWLRHKQWFGEEDDHFNYRHPELGGMEAQKGDYLWPMNPDRNPNHDLYPTYSVPPRAERMVRRRAKNPEKEASKGVKKPSTGAPPPRGPIDAPAPQKPPPENKPPPKKEKEKEKEKPPPKKGVKEKKKQPRKQPIREIPPFKGGQPQPQQVKKMTGPAVFANVKPPPAKKGAKPMKVDDTGPPPSVTTPVTTPEAKVPVGTFHPTGVQYKKPTVKQPLAVPVPGAVQPPPAQPVAVKQPIPVPTGVVRQPPVVTVEQPVPVPTQPTGVFHPTKLPSGEKPRLIPAATPEQAAAITAAIPPRGTVPPIQQPTPAAVPVVGETPAAPNKPFEQIIHEVGTKIAVEQAITVDQLGGNLEEALAKKTTDLENQIQQVGAGLDPIGQTTNAIAASIPELAKVLATKGNENAVGIVEALKEAINQANPEGQRPADVGRQLAALQVELAKVGESNLANATRASNEFTGKLANELDANNKKRAEELNQGFNQVGQALMNGLKEVVKHVDDAAAKITGIKDLPGGAKADPGKVKVGEVINRAKAGLDGTGGNAKTTLEEEMPNDIARQALAAALISNDLGKEQFARMQKQMEAGFAELAKRIPQAPTPTAAPEIPWSDLMDVLTGIADPKKTGGIVPKPLSEILSTPEAQRAVAKFSGILDLQKANLVQTVRAEMNKATIKQNEENEKKIKDLGDDVAAKNKQIAALKSDLEATLKDVNDGVNKVKEHEKAIEDLKAEKNKPRLSLNTKKKLEKEIGDEKAKLKAEEEKLNAANDLITTLKDEGVKAAKEKNDLLTQINDLKAGVSSTNKKIHGLENEVKAKDAAAQAAAITAKKREDELNKQLEDLKKQLGGAKKQYSDYQNEVRLEKAKANNDALKTAATKQATVLKALPTLFENIRQAAYGEAGTIEQLPKAKKALQNIAAELKKTNNEVKVANAALPEDLQSNHKALDITPTIQKMEDVAQTMEGDITRKRKGLDDIAEDVGKAMGAAAELAGELEGVTTTTTTTTPVEEVSEKEQRLTKRARLRGFRRKERAEEEAASTEKAKEKAEKARARMLERQERRKEEERVSKLKSQRERMQERMYRRGEEAKATYEKLAGYRAEEAEQAAAQQRQKAEEAMEEDIALEQAFTQREEESRIAPEIEEALGMEEFIGAQERQGEQLYTEEKQQEQEQAAAEAKTRELPAEALPSEFGPSRKEQKREMKNEINRLRQEKEAAERDAAYAATKEEAWKSLREKYQADTKEGVLAAIDAERIQKQEMVEDARAALGKFMASYKLTNIDISRFRTREYERPSAQAGRAEPFDLPPSRVPYMASGGPGAMGGVNVYTGAASQEISVGGGAAAEWAPNGTLRRLYEMGLHPPPRTREEQAKKEIYSYGHGGGPEEGGAEEGEGQRGGGPIDPWLQTSAEEISSQGLNAWSKSKSADAARDTLEKWQLYPAALRQMRERWDDVGLREKDYPDPQLRERMAARWELYDLWTELGRPGQKGENMAIDDVNELMYDLGRIKQARDKMDYAHGGEVARIQRMEEGEEQKAGVGVRSAKGGGGGSEMRELLDDPSISSIMRSLVSKKIVNPNNLPEDVRSKLQTITRLTERRGELKGTGVLERTRSKIDEIITTGGAVSSRKIMEYVMRGKKSGGVPPMSQADMAGLAEMGGQLNTLLQRAHHQRTLAHGDQDMLDSIDAAEIALDLYMRRWRRLKRAIMRTERDII